MQAALFAAFGRERLVDLQPVTVDAVCAIRSDAAQHVRSKGTFVRVSMHALGNSSDESQGSAHTDPQGNQHELLYLYRHGSGS